MADIKIVLSADASKVEKQLAKTLSSVVTTFDKAGAKSKGAADKSGESWKKSNEKAFGSQARSMVMGYMASIGGVAAAVRMIGDAWRYTQERQEGAARAARESLNTGGALSQVTKTDQEFRMASAQARQIRTLGGAESMAEANQTVFSLRSAGLTSEQDVLFAAQAKGVFDPNSLAESTGKLRSAFPAGEVGSLKDVTSKGMAAAAPVSGVNVGGMLSVMPIAAGAASRLGMTDEELMAMISVATQRMGSPERAATAVNRMLGATLEAGAPKGAGMANILFTMQQKVKDMSFGERQTFLGGIRGEKGFSALEMGDFQPVMERQSAIEEAQRTGAAGQAIRRARSDPIFEAARLARAAEGSKEVASMEVESIARNKARAIMDKSEARGLRRGDSSFEIWGRRAGQKFVRMLTGDEGVIDEWGDDTVNMSFAEKIMYYHARKTGKGTSEQNAVNDGGNAAEANSGPMVAGSQTRKPVLVEFNNVGKDPVIPSWDPRYTGK